MTPIEIIEKINSLPNPHTSNHSVWCVHMKNFICRQNKNLQREQIFQSLNREHLIVIYSLTLLKECLNLKKMNGHQPFFPNSEIQQELIYGLLKEISETISE
jgi:hypothetical protein